MGTRVDPAQLLTPAEAAQMLRLNPRTVVRLAREGRIPAVKVGERWRIKTAAVEPRGETKARSARAKRRSAGATAKDFSVAELLRPELVILKLEAADKRAALLEVALRLVEEGHLSKPQSFLESLLEREELMSTRIAEGVAVPHPRRATPGMFAESVVALAVSPGGVDFGGGVSVNVMFVICASDDRSHLRILARLSRLLRDTAICRKLLSAGRPAEAVKRVAEAERALPAEKR